MPLLVAAILGILVVLGVMALPLFCGQVNTKDDLGWLHLPSRIFYADCLAKGEAFDWMPGIFSGFYLTGSGDVAGYHPLHWLIYRWLPLPVAFEIELLAAYPLMLLGMFLWLRRWGMPREVAAVGGLIFTLSSFNLLHFVHPNMVGAGPSALAAGGHRCCLLFGIASLLFVLAARGWGIGVVGLIVFTIVDLGVYGLSYSMPPGNVERIEGYLQPGPRAPGNRQMHCFRRVPGRPPGRT